MAAIKSRSQKSRLGQLKDEELIELIAREKNEDALGELFQRFHSNLYSMAMRILNHHQAAEDVLQESMLRVWRHAGTYRPEAPARTWLFRIVALRSVSAMRRMQAAKSRERPLVKEKIAPRQERAAKPDDELLVALQQSLKTLPYAERILVVLFYGGGLSQQEIGKQLDLSQQVISYRLRKALASLRSALRKIGLSATVPAIESVLGKAVCSGFESTANGGQILLPSSILGTKTGGFHLALPVGLVLSVSLVAGGMAMGIYSTTPGYSSAKVESSDTTETRLLNAWTFEQGQPPGMKVLAGEWIDVPGEDNFRPGVAADHEDGLLVQLPVDAVGPHKVTVHYQNQMIRGPNKFLLSLKRMNKGHSLPFERVLFGTDRHSDGSFIVEHVTFPDHTLTLVDGEGLYIDYYDPNLEYREYALGMKSVVAEKIEVYELGKKEAQALETRFNPDALRNAGKRFEVLSKRAVIKRPRPALQKVWTFDSEAGDDLKVMKGEWSWQRQQGATPAARRAPYSDIQLPLAASAKPIHIRVKARTYTIGPLACYAFWGNGRQGWTPNNPNQLRESCVLLAKPKTERNDSPFTFDFYFDTRHIIHLTNNKLHSVSRYQRPFPSSKIHLELYCLEIESISIQEMDREQMPLPVRAPEALFKQMDKRPHRLTEYFHAKSPEMKRQGKAEITYNTPFTAVSIP